MSSISLKEFRKSKKNALLTKTSRNFFCNFSDNYFLLKTNKKSILLFTFYWLPSWVTDVWSFKIKKFEIIWYYRAIFLGYTVYLSSILETKTKGNSENTLCRVPLDMFRYTIIKMTPQSEILLVGLVCYSMPISSKLSVRSIKIIQYLVLWQRINGSGPNWLKVWTLASSFIQCVFKVHQLVKCKILCVSFYFRCRCIEEACILALSEKNG